MEKELENLVKEAESAIQSRSEKSRTKAPASVQLPRTSIAIVIWLIVIISAAFQFETVVKLVSGPTETKIESDLGGVLNTAARSIRAYEINNGALPFLLPNPAIRGLVRYERQTDHRFRLEATIGDVTMVMESSQSRPHRQER